MPLSMNDFIRAMRLPDEQAITYLKKKEPTLTWSAEEYAQFTADARARTFTIAKVTQLDVLQDVLDALTKAAEDGTPYSEFKKEIKTLLEPKGWYGKQTTTDTTPLTPWRLNTIYRTNMQSAYSSGRFNRQMEVVDKRPFMEFDAVVDLNTTQGCLELNGIVLRYDDPFWINNYPPRHYRCRSSVSTLSKREIERDGIVITDPTEVDGVMPQKGFEGTPDNSFIPDKKNYDKKLWNEFESSLP